MTDSVGIAPLAASATLVVAYLTNHVRKDRLAERGVELGEVDVGADLQERLALPFWHYSIDHPASAKVLPSSRIDSGEFPWPGLRQQFFAGFHSSIAAFAGAGNNLIVEHVVETEDRMRRLVLCLEGFDVFFVGLHCPLEELERRARLRGHHKLAEARADFVIAHAFGTYDFECSSMQAIDVIAAQVVDAWAARTGPSAFATMLRELRSADSKPDDHP